MKHCIPIPLFRADKISEAEESEINSELMFSSRSEDYEADDYVCMDGYFRSGTGLFYHFIVEAEDRHEAFEIACGRMMQALEEVDRGAELPQAA